MRGVSKLFPWPLMNFHTQVFLLFHLQSCHIVLKESSFRLDPLRASIQRNPFPMSRLPAVIYRFSCYSNTLEDVLYVLLLHQPFSLFEMGNTQAKQVTILSKTTQTPAVGNDLAAVHQHQLIGCFPIKVTLIVYVKPKFPVLCFHNVSVLNVCMHTFIYFAVYILLKPVFGLALNLYASDWKLENKSKVASCSVCLYLGHNVFKFLK